jgi:hypothetical protein|tara:strand:+ start:91 stop:600 length:510 start_codon:yes stop_codon:yes gene_type:complete
MISITISEKEIEKFLLNIKRNIQKEMGNLTNDITIYAKKQARLHAPIFDEKLKESIYRRANKKTGKGKVSVRLNQMNVALLNELGWHAGKYSEAIIQGKKGLYTPYNLASPKLKRWMDAKGKTRLYPNGPNTRMGKMNKFMRPAFLDTVQVMPQIVEKRILKAVPQSLV